MKNHITNIIEDFSSIWDPQTISVAEAVFGRFIAGETLQELGVDYDLTTPAIESAIRFFALKWKGDAAAKELYDYWQRRRFEGESLSV